MTRDLTLDPSVQRDGARSLRGWRFYVEMLMLTVRSTDSRRRRRVRQAPGGSSKVPFDKEGVAEVRCSIHPKMKLIITVKK